MAGELDILASVGGGAASGSVIPGWGTAIGAGIGLASGIAKYLGSRATSQAMVAQSAEELRRKKLRDASVLGETQAAGAASGVEYDSTSLQNYLTAMQTEMTRQQEYMRRSGATNAGNVAAAGGFGLVTDIASSMSTLAKQNNYWREK